MSRVSTKQRHDGYIQLEKDIGTDAHFRSFLEGICYAEKIIASEKQDQPEPVAWMKEDEDGDLEFNTLNQFSCGRTNGIPLYLHPAPQRSFVRLSEEEICIVMDNVLEGGGWIDVARAIEDALEKANA